MTLHPLIQSLLDDECTIADLPPELRPEGERLLRLMRLMGGEHIMVSQQVEQRVMAVLRERAARRRSLWAWLSTPLQLRMQVRPWLLGVALAGIAGVTIIVARRPQTPAAVVAPSPVEAVVRFVFYAPDAHHVAVAGSFNDWSPGAAPLARLDGGIWAITLALRPGQHQYAFVVDGQRWVADPGAPTVDDGFGRRNSVLAIDRPVAAL